MNGACTAARSANSARPGNCSPPAPASPHAARSPGSTDWCCASAGRWKTTASTTRRWRRGLRITCRYGGGLWLRGEEFSCRIGLTYLLHDESSPEPSGCSFRKQGWRQMARLDTSKDMKHNRKVGTSSPCQGTRRTLTRHAIRRETPNRAQMAHCAAFPPLSDLEATWQLSEPV